MTVAELRVALSHWPEESRVLLWALDGPGCLNVIYEVAGVLPLVVVEVRPGALIPSPDQGQQVLAIQTGERITIDLL